MGLGFHDRQHIQRLLVQENELTALFNEFILSVSPELRKWSNMGKSNIWQRNRHIENLIDRELDILSSNLQNVISQYQKDAWLRSDGKNKQLIEGYLKGMPLKEVTKRGMFAPNATAMNSFLKEANLTVSDNVWNITSQTKTQLEFYLQSGLSTGNSASRVSQDVRQLLQNPDKKFHRIWEKDKNGDKKLVMSQPMKDYHPGQGVYRSSYMNALRLSATETNRAYRKADNERWRGLDFVTGIEVSRSGNNNGACRICDPMVGEYPKEFQFTGWHPFCICVATPILLPQDEFVDSLFTDNINPDKYTTDIPQGAKDFIDSNKAVFENNAPYFIKDNATFIDIGSSATIGNRNKYLSYGDNWQKSYFDDKTGGYVVTEKQRIISAEKSKNELAKYQKEVDMCNVLAKSGYRIEHLVEVAGVSSPDVKINEIFADLKRTKGAGNIINYAIKATEKQGAEIVLFQFEEMNAKILGAINALKLRNIKGKYFITGKEDEIISF